MAQAALTTEYQYWVDHLAAALMRGEIGQVADCFRTPVPFFRRCGVRASVTRDEVMAELTALRARLRAAGVQAMRGTVRRAEEGEGARFRLDVDWSYEAPDAAEPLRASVTYFGRRVAPRPADPCTLCIEMLDYRREAFPMGDVSTVPCGQGQMH
ncbi:MAG: hypothetical protein V2I65_01465 [Paracoccaceae bacterium]|jgi:hypothetical protein|nr:hypothetical protein [Paracoccaceae bacterium]